MKNFTLFIFLFVCSFATAQNNLSIPKSYKNLEYDNQGKLFFKKANGEIAYADTTPAIHTLERLIGKPQGTATGISFDFGIPDFKGTLYFGFIPYGDSKHPQPVYFRSPAKIENGKAEINITQMKGTYDMVGWVKSGKGTLGYRVVNDKGAMIYDGKISFIYTNNTFTIATTITEGPFINRLTSEGATISLTTNLPAIVSIEIDGKSFSDTQASTQHEILVTGLEPNKQYTYKVNYPSDNQQVYAFKTAPQGGARTKFSFAYASDSRAGQGGGERNMYGANYYIMKKITALAHSKNAAFFQFTGDLIDGYLIDKGETELQYANWKRSVEIFWHYMPIYAAMGNHEALNYRFEKNAYSIDRFPYETESAEAIFAKHFVNPLNGLESEDGSKYDKNKKGIDFPSYKENVFYYVYDNVAVIVLNSNYWFAPSRTKVGEIGGNIHAYIMDNQVAWLKNTLATLEKDGNIDHVFVTEHTPFFPNGGHVRDDMWYGGDNNPRPCFAEGCADKGIIERRDEMLDLLVNQSTKVRAILTGDEHNYAKTKLTPETIIHPENYPHQKVKLSRTIWQINNGAAGAPYYAQEQTPWTPFVSGFSTQNAVVFFHVEGKRIFMEVFNPDTLEKFDELQLVD